MCGAFSPWPSQEVPSLSPVSPLPSSFPSLYLQLPFCHLHFHRYTIMTLQWRVCMGKAVGGWMMQHHPSQYHLHLYHLHHYHQVGDEPNLPTQHTVHARVVNFLPWIVPIVFGKASCRPTGEDTDTASTPITEYWECTKNRSSANKPITDTHGSRDISYNGNDCHMWELCLVSNMRFASRRCSMLRWAEENPKFCTLLKDWGGDVWSGAHQSIFAAESLILEAKFRVWLHSHERHTCDHGKKNPPQYFISRKVD